MRLVRTEQKFVDNKIVMIFLAKMPKVCYIFKSNKLTNKKGDVMSDQQIVDQRVILETITGLLKKINLEAIIAGAVYRAVALEHKRQTRSAGRRGVEQPFAYNPIAEKIVNETVVFSADGLVPVKELAWRVNLSQKWISTYMRSRGCVADRRTLPNGDRMRVWLGARFKDGPSIS